MVTHGGRTFTIGQLMSREDLDFMPVGAVVVCPQGRRWVKRHPISQGWRREEQGDGRGTSQLSVDYNHLVSIPDAEEAGPETLAQFKRRFATHVITGARNARVSLGPVYEALAKLGVEAGGRAVVGHPVNRSTPVPDGTVAVYGDPSHPDFSVFTYNQGQWRGVLGKYTHIDDVGSATVVTVGKSVDAEDPEPTDHEDALIAEFKAKVWAEGWAVKQRVGWCSTFETVMAGIGITGGAVGPDLSGYPSCGPGDRRGMGAGALIVRVEGNDWAMFTRSEGWQRVAGADLRLRSQAFVLHDGNGGMAVPVTRWLADAVPVGSTMGDVEMDAYWTKREMRDGVSWWQRNGGVYSAAPIHNFTLGTLRLTSVPVPVDDDEEF